MRAAAKVWACLCRRPTYLRVVIPNGAKRNEGICGCPFAGLPVNFDGGAEREGDRNYQQEDVRHAETISQFCRNYSDLRKLQQDGLHQA